MIWRSGHFVDPPALEGLGKNFGPIAVQSKPLARNSEMAEDGHWTNSHNWEEAQGASASKRQS